MKSRSFPERYHNATFTMRVKEPNTFQWLGEQLSPPPGVQLTPLALGTEITWKLLRVGEFIRREDFPATITDYDAQAFAPGEWPRRLQGERCTLATPAEFMYFANLYQEILAHIQVIGGLVSSDAHEPNRLLHAGLEKRIDRDRGHERVSWRVEVGWFHSTLREYLLHTEGNSYLLVRPTVTP